MFSKILTCAVLAGFAAGLVAAVLQLAFLQPVLLHAELYEGGVLTHFGPDGAAEGADGGAPPDPGFDVVRNGLSVLFSALIYVGYGLLLVAAMAFAAGRGARVNAESGLIWGIAGWVAVQMAPAFGLPPELPGSAAADVGVRQVWWFGAVAVTAAALWLVAFGRRRVVQVAGLALILTPHLIGAPHPGAFAGPVPPELAAEFAARALGVGLAAWALLGVGAGHMWSRESA